MVKQGSERKIVIICAIYFLISIIFFVLFHEYALIQPDTASYVDVANNLLENGFFSRDGITPDYFRTPGYPLFLALIFMMGGNNEVAAIIQIVLSTFGLYLSYKIFLLLNTSKNLAIVGAALFLFNLTSYQYASAILSESLFAFALICAVYCFIRYVVSGQQSFGFFVSFTVAINYALFTRPILMYFNMLLVIAMFIFFAFKKVRLKHAITFLMCFIVVFGGWSYRNYRHSSVFLYSTVRGYNLMYYDSSILKARMEGISIGQAIEYHQALFDGTYPQIFNSDMNAAQLSVLYGEYGSRYIKNHFPQYLIHNTVGLFTIMFGPSQAFIFDISPNIAVAYLACGVYMAYLAFIYILSLCGIILNYRNIGILQLFILALCGYLAVASASVGYSRFREPIFFLILVIAISNSTIVIEKAAAMLPNNIVVSKVKDWLLRS